MSARNEPYTLLIIGRSDQCLRAHVGFNVVQTSWKQPYQQSITLLPAAAAAGFSMAASDMLAICPLPAAAAPDRRSLTAVLWQMLRKKARQYPFMLPSVRGDIHAGCVVDRSMLLQQVCSFCITIKASCGCCYYSGHGHLFQWYIGVHLCTRPSRRPRPSWSSMVRSYGSSRSCYLLQHIIIDASSSSASGVTIVLLLLLLLPHYLPG